MRPDFTPALTPIEKVVGGIVVKRDDLFSLAGVRGGKVRSCWRLAQGAMGLVTACSRFSPQGNIVAQIGRRMHIPTRIHLAFGPATTQMEMAQEAGGDLIRHRPGHNTVIIARARQDAQENHWKEIPFGMRCFEAVEETSLQVDNLPQPHEFKRIVVAVGSGISLAGILLGISQRRHDLIDTPILGIQVGASPLKHLDTFAQFGWRTQVDLRMARQSYHETVQTASLGNIELDPHYEAKCLPFLRPYDLFWLVGIRAVDD